MTEYELMNLKPGDLLIGNKLARRYSVTAEGVRCRFMQRCNYSDKLITVAPENRSLTFNVDYNCFDLYVSCKPIEESELKTLV